MSTKEINCKLIFKSAYEKRYTWTKDFSGFKGKCSFLRSKESFQGEFILGKDFKPQIKNINDQGIVKSISSQLFEVSIHRVKREFDEIHLKNNFNLIKSSDKGIEMIVSGKNEGDKYRVKNNCINMVYRKIHGVIIQIFISEFFDTGNGFLSKKYTSQQIDPETLEVKSLELQYEDIFTNVGYENIWLLKSRTIKYSNKTGDEEIQKFIFEDIQLLEK